MNSQIAMIENGGFNLMESSEVSVHLIIEKYLSTLGSDLTKASYKKSIYEFLNFKYGTTDLYFGHLVVNPTDAEEYARHFRTMLENGDIKKSTYNSKIKGAKSFYDWLTKVAINNITQKALLVGNPFATIKLMVENDSDGSMPLTPEEILLMLNNPYGHNEHTQERNQLMLEIGIVTGIRNTALLSLSPSKLSKLGEVWVIEVVQKGGKLTKKPISEDLYNRLMEWYAKDLELRRKDNGTFFNMTSKSSNEIIKFWCDQVKIEKKISFHSLRTTTAVEINRNNNNIYEAQEFLDHTNAAVTGRYLKKQKNVNMAGIHIISDIREATNVMGEIETFEKNDILEAIDKLPIQMKMAILNELKKK